MIVIATGGADHLVKLWAVSRREELEQQNQQPGSTVAQLLAYQSFTGHMGPVTGAAFLGTQLVTVGQDGNVAVWNMNTSSTAASYQQQQRGIREPHPDLNVTMRSWLERTPAAEAAVSTSPGGACAGEAGSSVVAAAALARRMAGAAAGVAGGVVVPELQAALQDPGISPSPLFSCSAQQQTHTTSRSGATAATAAAEGGVVPAPVHCSALLGFNAHVAGGLLWLRQQGLLAQPTGNVLVLSHLATHQQQLLQHHSQPIGAVALSSDGQLLATASAGPEPASGCAEVCVWELSSQRLRLVLCQHPLDCQLLEFSPDGCWLVSFGGRQLVLWDLETGEAAAIGKTNKAVSGIAWLPWRPLPQFLTSGGDGLLLWTLQPTFLEQRSLTVPDAAGAAFSAVCSAASSGGLPHSSMSGEELDPAQQAAVKAQAACTAFAADEAGGIWQLAVGEGRLLGCAKVANLEPGQTATRLQWSQRSAALAAATSSGALLRYTCSSADSSSSDGVVHQWWAAGSVSSAGGAGVLPQWVAAGALQLDGPITSLQLEPQLLCEGLVGSAAATAWYVDMREQQQAPLLAGHAAEITGLVGSAAAGGRDGSGVVASLCEDGWLALWQTGSGSQVLPLAEFRSEQAVSSVAFQPGCVGCVVGYTDGRLALFDLTAAAGAAAGGGAAGGAAGGGGSGGVGVIRWSVVRHASPVISVALHPSQPLVMAASRDGLITVTNSDSLRLVASCRDLTGSTIPLHALAVQPAPHGSSSSTDSSTPGSMAAAAWLDRLLVFRTPWQASQAHVVCSYQCPEVPEVLPPVRSCVSFVPGSANLLLFASPCLQAAALLFDCAAGQPLRTLELPGSPTSLAVCPSGQLLAFGLEDGRVMVADASGEDSSVLGCGGVPGVRVSGLAFTAGGRHLVSAAGRVMAVWDA